MTCRSSLQPTAAHHIGQPFHRPPKSPHPCDYAEMDCVSTRTPTPMVDETATFFKYTPLLDAGLALVKASISAARLPCSLSVSNERRPMRAVHDTGLVNAELHLASLCVLDSGGDVRRHSANLGVRHQATWAQDLAQGTDDTHGIGAMRSQRRNGILPALMSQPGHPCRRCQHRRPWLLQPWRPGRTRPHAWFCRCHWAARRRHAQPGRTSWHRCRAGRPRRWTHRTWQQRIPSRAKASVRDGIQLVAVDLDHRWSSVFGQLGSFTHPPQ
jgi:hypothetical protein